MPTYFAANGIDAFELSPTPPRASGDAVNLGGDPSTYADAMLLDPVTGAPAALTRAWTHVYLAPDAGVYDGNRFPLTWKSAAGVDVVQADGIGRGLVFRYRGPDGAWRELGSFQGLGSGALDALIVVHETAGRLALFWNNGLLIDLKDINTSGIGNIGRVRFRGASGYDGQPISNVIVASYSTIGHYVRTRRPTAAGAETGWSGDVAAVAKGPVDDTTTIGATAVGQVATFAGTVLSPTPAGNIVKAVTVAARVRNDDSGEGPQNVRPVLRIGGVNRPAAYPLRIGLGFSGALAVFNVDPATGAPWAGLDDANGEFGLQAVA